MTLRQPSPSSGGTSGRYLALAVVAALSMTLSACGISFSSAGADGATGSSSHQPGNPPASGRSDGESVTIAAISDFGNCAPGAEEIATMVKGWEPVAIVTAGDNAYTAPNCKAFVDSVGRFYDDYVNGPQGHRFWPALGNHDLENEDAGLEKYRAYFDYLPKDANPDSRWYEKTIDGVNFFVLDNDAPEPEMAAQRAWAQAAIENARSKDPKAWNVAVFHKPPYTSGPHEPFAPMRRSAGWNFKEWGTDLVIVAHQHTYEDVDVKGLHYVNIGAASSDKDRPCPKELTKGSEGCLTGAGAAKLSFGPEKLTLTYHQMIGGTERVTDTVTVER